MSTPPGYNATIAARQLLHDNLMMLSIAPDGGEFPAFEPGQYVSVGRVVTRGGRAQLVKRPYSIGSSARSRATIELFLVHVDDGEFTSWLFARKVGARVWLSPSATGGFTLDGVARDSDLVLVCTGTAVAPYVSMIRTYGDDPPWRRAVLINGVRLAADLGYRAELESLAARDARFTYVPVATRERSSSWRGMRGRVTELIAQQRFADLAGFDLDPATCHVFVSGNPVMIEELESSLRALGFRKHTRAHPGNLHLEKYWTE